MRYRVAARSRDQWVVIDALTFAVVAWRRNRSEADAIAWKLEQAAIAKEAGDA